MRLRQKNKPDSRGLDPAIQSHRRLHDKMRHSRDRERFVIDAAGRVENEQIAGFCTVGLMGNLDPLDPVCPG